MKEIILFQRDFAAQRKDLSVKLRKENAAIEGSPEAHANMEKLLERLQHARWEYDKSLAKNAGRMVGEAISIAQDLMWDITVTKAQTAITVAMTPSCLLDLSFLSNLICHAETFGIDISDPGNVKLRFTYPTHKLIWL